MFASIKEIKAMARERYFIEEFHRLQKAFADGYCRIFTLNQSPRPILEIVASGGVVLVLLIALLQGRASADVVGVLGLFAMGAARILPGINRGLFAYYAIKNGTPMATAIVNDFEDRALDGFDTNEKEERQRLAFEKVVEFDNVSFSYRGASESAIKNVSLVIHRGEALGLVGASGAGKSTVVDILLGLLRPQAGRILVDGRDISTDLQQWRHLVGYVPQSISLIDDSLRKNIAFGVNEEQIDDVRVWDALKMAKLDHHARSLPMGLDTLLGERGTRLSGGQRQRVGIARALYHGPEVLVLDEATSALDNQIEHDISVALDLLRGSKTVIIIAHRLSTVKGCDRLLLMRNGQIADLGPFYELTDRNEEFRKMVRLAELTADQPSGKDAVI